MKREMTVGEVARRSGVAVSTLHFYEAKELISSNRSAGNQRRYSSDVLRRIGVIKFAQQLGVPLAEIARALAKLPGQRTPNRADWKMIAATWELQLDERIEHLQRLRNNLTECIGCGCLSLRRCAIRNPDDQLSKQGPGPRNLVQDRIK